MKWLIKHSTALDEEKTKTYRCDVVIVFAFLD